MKKYLLIVFIFLLGLAKAQNSSLLPIRVNYQWGYINTLGQVVISPRFERAGTFTEFHYAIVQLASKSGLIDTAGKEILPFQYDRLEVLDSGLIKVKKDSLWALHAIDYGEICPYQYTEIRKLQSPFYLINQNDKWGVLNKSGKITLSVQYDTIFFNKKYPFFILRDSGKTGIARIDGKILSACINLHYRIVHPNLIMLKKNWGWEGIDSNGIVRIPNVPILSESIIGKKFVVFKNSSHATLYNEQLQKIISDSTYHDFILTDKEYIITVKNKKLGLLSESGELLSEPIYTNIIQEESIIKIQKEGKWGILSSNGKVLFPPAFDIIGKFQNGIALLKNGDRWGIINNKGKVIYPCIADKVIIQKNQAEVYTDLEKIFFTFDKSGNVIEQIRFKKIKTLNIASRDQNLIDTSNRGFRNNRVGINDAPEGYGWFQKGNKWGLKDSTGRLFIPAFLDQISVFPDLGLTLVSINSFDRDKGITITGYGVVDHERKKFLLRPGSKDVQITDFENGYVARVLLNSGPALLTREGKIISSMEVFENGKIKVQHIAYIGEFSEDKARINVGGKKILTRSVNKVDGGTWGYINREGEFAVKPKFQHTYDFKQDRAIVKYNYQWGVINTSGEFIIPNNYDYISFVPDSNDSLFYLKKNKSKAGILSKDGKIIIEPTFEDIGEFSEDLAKVKEKGRWGFINISGDSVISFQFKDAKNFNQGLAAVKNKNYWGFVDQRGQTIIPFEYNEASDFFNGLAMVKKKGKTGYINKEGKTVIPFKYLKGTDFQGTIAAVKPKRKFGIINMEGKWIINPSFTHIEFYPNNYAIVKNKRKYGMINPEGKWIIKCKYKKVLPVSESLIQFTTKDGLCGFFDTTGSVVIPAQYNSASSFSEGKALVRMGNKWGYINTAGTWIIEPTFRKGTSFQEGMAYISTDKENGFIDTSGNLVISLNSFTPFYFSEGFALIKNKDYYYFLNLNGSKCFHEHYEKAFPFSNGMSVVKYKNSTYGVIDKSGNKIIDTRYDNIEAFKGDYAIILKDAFLGVADINGKIIVSPDFEAIEFLETVSLFKAEKGDAVGYFDLFGNWIWKPTK